MPESPSTPPPDVPATHYELRVDSDIEGGAYADFLGVWHTAHEFTLDFAAMLPPEAIQTPDGPAVKVPCRVTARVKVPPTLVFEILKALNQNMTGYEEEFGEIRRPGPPTVPGSGGPRPPDVAPDLPPDLRPPDDEAL